MKSIAESIPVEELPRILERAAEVALKRENVREICKAVFVSDESDHVGSAYSGPYLCYNIFKVEEIKKILVAKTLEDLAQSLGSEICKGILRHIETKVKTKLNHQFNDLKINLSDETFARMTVVVVAITLSIIMTTFGFLIEIIALTVLAVVVYVQSIDVNSISWREKIADEIYNDVSGKKNMLIEKIMPTVMDMCVGTRNELKALVEKIHAEEIKIVLADQNERKFKDICILTLST